MIYNDKNLQCLTVRFSGELFAVDITRVKNIIHNIDVRKTGNNSDYVTGFIHIEGKIIPLIDVKAKMGIKKEPCCDPCIIVAEIDFAGQKRLFCFEADSVQEALSTNVSEIKPAHGRYEHTGFLTGIVKCGYKLVKILDIDKIYREEDNETLIKDELQV